MQLHKHLVKSIFGKAALAAAALSGLFFFAGAPSAQAHPRDCDDRRVVRYDDYRLHRATEYHGYYSPQAAYWRHERREAFEHGWRDRYGCWHRY